MKIGEFSNKTNTSIDTLRYYDKIGLLVPKRKNNIRQYDADDLKTIEIINVLKDMKYSLDDIKEIIELDRKIDESIRQNSHCYDDIVTFSKILDEKYKELIKQQEMLDKAKKNIEHIKDKLNNYLAGVEKMIQDKIGVGLYSLTGVYGKKDKNQIKEMLEYAAKNGVTFFDMAESYSDAEEFTGKVLKPYRKYIKIATKLSLTDEGIMDCSYDYVIKACKKSLLKLDTDYIDLYQIHFDDPDTKAKETVEALEYLKKEGLIRAYGLGHLPYTKVKEYVEAGNPDTIMMEFSPVNINQYYKYIDLVRDHKIKILTMGTTGRGLLTGKIKKGYKFETGDIRNIDPLFHRGKFDTALKILDRLDQVAKKYDKTSVQVAINWAINKPFIYKVLVGPSNIDHLKENLSGQGWTLSKEDIEALDNFIQNENIKLKKTINEEILSILNKDSNINNIVSDLIYVLEGLADDEKLTHKDALILFSKIMSLKKSKEREEINKIKEEILNNL